MCRPSRGVSNRNPPHTPWSWPKSMDIPVTSPPLELLAAISCDETHHTALLADQEMQPTLSYSAPLGRLQAAEDGLVTCSGLSDQVAIASCSAITSAVASSPAISTSMAFQAFEIL